MHRPLIAVLALVSHAIAQQLPSPPRLVVDFDARPRTSLSSSPREYCAVAGMSYFAATDGLGVPGLYRSFGTAATTVRVAAFPGVPGGSPRYLRALGSRLFFVADDPSSGAEPWISDGSPEGTQRIADLSPGSSSTLVSGAYAVNGRMVFFGGPASGDHELFVSDGSAAGTQRLADIHPGSGSSTSSSIGTAAAVGRDANGAEYLAFMAFDGSEVELWRTDGTVLGTSRLSALAPRSEIIQNFEAATLSDGRVAMVLLGIDTGNIVRRLVVTDGSAAGTSIGTPPAVGAAFIERGNQGVAFDGRVWFRHFQGLLASDGSAAGTQVVAGVPQIGTTLILGVSRDALWFLAGVGSSVSDRLAKIDRNGVVTDFGLLPFRFVASSGAVGRQHAPLGEDFVVSAASALWRIDTASGTAQRLAASVTGGTVAGIGGRAWFSIHDEAFGAELGITDGSPAGTRLVADLATEPGSARTLDSRPSLFAAQGRNAVFAASDGTGRVVVSSDGTALGTRILASGFSQVSGLVAAGRHVYFAASSAATGSEVWHSDGTAAGTSLVLDLAPGTSSSLLGSLNSFGDRVVFLAWDGVDVGLFAASPDAVTRLVALPRTPSSSRIVQYGSRVVALFQYAGIGAELLVSDGSPAGTAVIAQFPLSATLSRNALVHRELVWFGIARNDRVVELHATDGSAAGTRMVGTLVSGLPSQLLALASSEQRLFAVQSAGLFAMDDPALGVRRVTLPASILALDPSQTPLVVGERVIFASFEAGSTRGVWSSDGSASGTEALLGGLSIAATGTEARAAGGQFALLRSLDAAGVARLHATDGRPLGTSVLAAIDASLGSGGIEATQTSVVVDGRFWFSAGDPVAGIEPHVVELASAGMPIGAACGGLGRAASLQVDRLPVLGSNVQLGLRSAQGDLGVILLGFGDFAPQGLPVIPGCVLRVDPAQSVVFPALALSAGTANLPLPIPALPLLANLELVAQAALGATDAPLGFDLSNAVVLRLGH
jgi:ELWxxDGT repeat protein